MNMTQAKYDLRSHQQATYEPEQYKSAIPNEAEQRLSVIDRQMTELQTQLNFLRSVVEALEHRLHPVLVDMPVKSFEQDKLTAVMSPIASAFYEAQQRVNRESMNLQSLIERLEV